MESHDPCAAVPCTLSFIVPVYNALADAQQCLESIERSRTTAHEIIIVDDGSEADTRAMLREFADAHENVSLYSHVENLGVIKSCNAAMQRATGDIVVLLHSDTVVPCGFAERVFACFDSEPKVAIASPLANSGGRSIMKMPDGQNLDEINRLIREHYAASYPRLSSSSGFCLCVRRSLLAQLDYFDEVFGRGSYEEVDLCYRAIVEGYECALIDDLYILHKGHASFGAKLRSELKQQHEAVFHRRWRGFAERWDSRHRYHCPVAAIQRAIAPPVELPFKFYRKVKVGTTRKVYIAGRHILSYTRKPKAEKSPSMVLPIVIPTVSPPPTTAVARPDGLQTMLDKQRRGAYKAAFSIIMPTYNRAYCIRRAIDSVLAQWYENFELIIVDDASSDQTQVLLERYYAKELATKKMIYHKLDQHEGICGARNKGLSLANNEWIAYVDSDNFVYGNFLLSFADAISEHRTATTFYAKLFFRHKKTLLSRYFDHRALLMGNFIDMGVFVHHCSLPTLYGNFDLKAARLEDWDLIIRYTKDSAPCFVDALVLEYDDDDKADRMSTRFSDKIPKLYIQNKFKDMYSNR